MTSPSTAERVSTILTCLALDSRLGGVLFVGLSPRLLRPLARWLGSILTTAEIVTLGATQTDDDLWWRVGPSSADGRFLLRPGLGPLIDAEDGRARIVIVPDLARASTAVLRAAVTLIGAEAAVADRHGMHAAWRPRSRWLAACARSDVARLSPHLLDRFAIRIDAADLGTPGHDIASVRKALAAIRDADLALPDLPPAFRERLVRRDPPPPMTADAIRTAVALGRDVLAPVRRDLALARVGRSLAALEASDAVRADHVRQAAVLLGLLRDGQAQPPEQPPGGFFPELPDPSLGAPAADPGATEHLVTGTGGTAAAAAAGILDEAVFPPELIGSGTYQEDDADAMPEYASLREPWQRDNWTSSSRGHVIGTEPTRSLADLAVPATAFEAAKFQPVRHARGHGADGRLVIWGCDLRRYRRQPRPDTSVVLVLDHTCRRDWDWSAALAPYLRWGYVRRAALTVVELGYLGCQHELRADVYRARSVLDSRVRESLGRAPGRATPLAHALDLAIQEVRRQLRHREVAAENSWLVVVSDGRGNVPLQVSQRLRFDGAVGTEGVTDALAVARTARTLPPVHRIVLPPPHLTHYTALPFELADAIGGVVAEPT